MEGDTVACALLQADRSCQPLHEDAVPLSFVSKGMLRFVRLLIQEEWCIPVSIFSCFT